MSNVETPNVNADGETTNQELVVEQSGIPAMTKKFTIETNTEILGDLDVTGTVTATSFIGDGSQLTGISGGGDGGLDSAGVTLLVDSDYVQARETPQDFAYSSLTGAPTALSSFTNDTNFVDSVGVISAVTSSDLDMGGNKVLFSNVYPTEADLPDATANHGMFAHVHATGAGYFAHAGSWVQLANDADIPVGGGLDSAGVQLLIDDDLIGSGLNSVAIGNGATSVGAFNVSVGLDASAPGQESISIGRNTIGFGDNAVAIGPAAKSYNGSVTIGHDAHAGNNGIDTVVIGGGAGGDNTGIRSVAIGFQSGGHTHGAYSPKVETTHIGGYAGRNDPQAYSTGIGAFAGGTTQGTESVAVGYYAGNDTQGRNAIAIGSWAAQTSQPENSIAISAIGNTPTGTAPPDGQYGIKIQTSDSGSLTYDTTTDWTFGATVNAPAFVGDGSGLTGLPSGGGLDSAGVQLLIDAEVDATTLVLGTGTTAGIRVGSGATASTLSGGGIAIGQNSTATGTQAIAIGIGAQGDNNAVAIGISTETASSSVSIGRSAKSRVQGVAVGMSSETASSATAIGYNAKAGNNTFGTGSSSVAVGKNAYSQYDYSMHINAATNLGTGPSAIGGIVIESTLGRLEYSAAADWVFNAGVTMTDLVASGATVVFNNLPTVDPVNAGQLWNDAGTMKISAG